MRRESWSGLIYEGDDEAMRSLAVGSVLVSVVLALYPTVAMAQVAPTLRETVALDRPLNIYRLQLSPLQIAQRFEDILKEKGVKQQVRDEAARQFKALPDDLQSSIILTLDERLAQAGHIDSLALSRVNPELFRQMELARVFKINMIWPSEGTPGAWSYAFGAGFDSNCVVKFDGNPVESAYLGMAIEFFPNSMAFKIPAGATRDSQHDIVVSNQNTGNDTAVVQYAVVAPRGYRGHHGWQFSNFSRPSIDWKLYADYFGRLNVEHADGTHRPAAQTWFDNAYTRAGAGGNCFGMSVSSLRVRNHEYDHMFHASYFQNPPSAQAHCWWYEWNDTTRETVQQQQGAWYTQEILDVHNDLWNNQTPRDVFNRCQSLISETTNRPILAYWGETASGDWWGHAVCPYSVEVDGDSRRMIVYDNNNPYRRNEAGSIDPDVATVAWGANTFSRGSATKAQLFSYDECTPPNPHLPGAEYGGPGANAVVAVLSPNTNVRQITDENGRTFFNPDGSLNENPGTRIPLSSIVPPLVQRPQTLPMQLPRPQLGQLQPLALQPPPDAVQIFVFGNAGGKSLSFDVAGAGEKSLNLFSNGRIFSAVFSGAGQLQATSLLQAPTLLIADPAALQPTSLEFIRSQNAGDRVFELSSLQNAGAERLQLIPNAPGTEVEVLGAPTLRFNLRIMGPVGQGAQQAQFQNLALQAGAKANLSPNNWGGPRRCEPESAPAEPSEQRGDPAADDRAYQVDPRRGGNNRGGNGISAVAAFGCGDRSPVTQPALPLPAAGEATWRSTTDRPPPARRPVPLPRRCPATGPMCRPPSTATRGGRQVPSAHPQSGPSPGRRYSPRLRC